MGDKFHLGAFAKDSRQAAEDFSRHTTMRLIGINEISFAGICGMQLVMVQFTISVHRCFPHGGDMGSAAASHRD